MQSNESNSITQPPSATELRSVEDVVKDLVDAKAAFDNQKRIEASMKQDLDFVEGQIDSERAKIFKFRKELDLILKVTPTDLI